MSLFANIITILAFFLALKAFFNWKKEQKDAKKLDYIMNLEDRFEILIHSIQVQFKHFSDLENLLIYTTSNSKEEKEQLINFMNKENQEYINKQTLIKDFDEYSLALLKVKRFIENIDKECKSLSWNTLNALSIESLKVKPKWNDKNNISTESKKILEKIAETRKEGIMYLRTKYK